MADLRKCIVCGQRYKYCIHCGDSKKEEPWRYLFHNEDCRDIAHMMRFYRGEQMSKQEVKDFLNKYPDSVEEIMMSDTAIATEIREILKVQEDVSVKEEPIVEMVENTVVKADKTQDTVDTKQKVDTKPTRSSRNRKK